MRTVAALYAVSACRPCRAAVRVDVRSPVAAARLGTGARVSRLAGELGKHGAAAHAKEEGKLQKAR